MIKIAIVDDEEYSAVKCRKLISTLGINNIQTDIFTDSKHFGKITIEKSEFFDIIILDIDMPDQSGFDIAKKIREVGLDVIIMFYTAHEQYVYKSFEFQPFRYIRKNNAAEELPFAIKCAIEKIEKDSVGYICIKDDGESIRLNIRNIVYCDKHEHTLNIFTADGKTYKTRKNISDLYNLLPEQYFAFANKGTIVNLMYVNKINPIDIKIENDISIPLSRRNYKDVKAKFSQFVGGLI